MNPSNSDAPFMRSKIEGMTDDEMESMVRAVFAEGATNDDIRWWWGMSQTERDSIVESDSAMRLAAFSHFCKDLHMDPKSAFRKLHETFIIYSDYPLEPRQQNRYLCAKTCHKRKGTISSTNEGIHNC